LGFFLPHGHSAAHHAPCGGGGNRHMELYAG
jgi:hypothetical protein